MKQIVFMIVAAIFLSVSSFAQDFNPKFGKVSDAEVSMAACEIDPEAAAMYIYDIGNISFSNRFEVVHDVYVRIKIFKKEAVDMADVSVPYVSSNDITETVRGVEANTYNMEDGKLVKTEMPKKNVFKEKVSDVLNLIKFSLPEVREGSVIEYKYSLSTSSLYRTPDLVIQHKYPVLHSRMEVGLPEFIGFNVRSQGRFPLNVNRDIGATNFTVGNMKYNINKVIVNHDNVPALKSEPMIWCLEDYRAKLETEVSGIELHVGDVHISEQYSHSWADVNKALQESKLGDCQKAKNPFKDEVKAITSQSIPEKDKIREILCLVRDKVKCEKDLGLIPDSPSAVVKKGKGDRADLNNLLSVALKDAGFQTEILFLNPRSLGRLSYFPTIQQIGTFVVGVKDTEGNLYCLDAGDPESDLNVMDPDFLVKNARIFGRNDDGWLDMSSLAQNSESVMVLASLEENGDLKGNYMETLTNQYAYSFNDDYHSAESEDKFIEENIEKENKIEVSSASFDGVGTMNVNTKVNFTMETDKNGDHIYINPTIIQFLGSNPFDRQQRTLPVEFDITGNTSMQVTLMLPEGFKVEESPSNIRVSACGGDVVFRYLAQVTGNTISARLTLSINRVFFDTEEYEDLRLLFGKIAEICNSKIVIKKS